MNGIKECFVLQAENKPQTHTAARSFVNTTAYRGFTLGRRSGANPPLGGDTCFAATATADTASNDSDFTIYMDANGVAVKTCTRGELAGCKPNSGNTGPGTW